MAIETKLAPIRKGLLEFLVLKIVGAQTVYVPDILRRLAGTEFATQEGTLYPLLSKLRREDLVLYEWQESDAGPPRKYYRLTDAGRAQLAALVREQREHMEDLKYRLKSLQEKLPDSYRVLAVAHRIDEVYEDEFTKELFVVMQKKKEEATMPRPGMQSSSSSAGAASFFVPPPSSSSFSSLIPAIHPESDRVDIEKGLVFLGLIGIHDPPKPQSRAAVEAARGKETQ